MENPDDKHFGVHDFHLIIISLTLFFNGELMTPVDDEELRISANVIPVSTKKLRFLKKFLPLHRKSLKNVIILFVHC